MTTTQSRRAMLWTLVALPAGLFLVQCGSGGSGGNGGGAAGANAPAAPPVNNGSSITYSSSTVAAHFHTFAITLSALQDPPDTGVSGSTSSANAHTHTVSVSAAQLESVSTGGSLKVTTSVTAGHSHVFTFVRVS